MYTTDGNSFLMLKLSILKFLIILIALQSTIAVADFHQTHQIPFEHLEIELQVEDTTDFEQLPEAKTDFSTVSYDSHHCCHCHGVACNFIISVDNAFGFLIESYKISKNKASFLSQVVSPDLRPPIV